MKSLLFVAAALSGLSQPKTFDQTIQFTGGTLGRTVTVCIDGSEVKTTMAGRLTFRDQNRSWSSYCADVRSPIAGGQFTHVRIGSAKLAGPNYRKAGHIVAKYLKLAKTADECAAIQLAVWEAVEDGGQTADFGSGRFMAQASDKVISLAQQAYQAGQDAGEGTYMQSQDGGQSQMTT